MNFGSESAVRALLVSNDPQIIEHLSKALQELAAATEVCTDVPSAVLLVNTRKFETVVVDLKLGEQSKTILERVRLSPSNHTTVAFAITAGSNFVLERPLFADLGWVHIEGCVRSDRSRAPPLLPLSYFNSCCHPQERFPRDSLSDVEHQRRRNGNAHVCALETRNTGRRPVHDSRPRKPIFGSE